MRWRILILISITIIACRADISTSAPVDSGHSDAETVSGHVLAATGRPPITPPSWNTPAWYIDPQNSVSGACASDTNNCTQSTCGAAGSHLGPCLTYGEVAARLGTYSPILNQVTTLTFLSNQTVGSDPVTWTPYLRTGATATIVLPSPAANISVGTAIGQQQSSVYQPGVQSLPSGSTFSLNGGPGAGAQNPSNEAFGYLYPNDTNRGPFSIGFMTGGSFNGTWDPVIQFGYNSAGQKSSEPRNWWQFESYYQPNPGTFWTEAHLNMFLSDGSTGVRPFTANQVIGGTGVGNVNTGINVRGGTLSFQDGGSPSRTWLLINGDTWTFGTAGGTVTNQFGSNSVVWQTSATAETVASTAFLYGSNDVRLEAPIVYLGNTGQTIVGGLVADSANRYIHLQSNTGGVFNDAIVLKGQQASTFDTQSTNGEIDFSVFANIAAGGGTVLQTTNYAPASGHGALLVVDWTARDKTNGSFYSGTSYASVKNPSGTVSIAGTNVSVGGQGDAALSTTSVTETVTSSLVNVSFQTPAAYANAVDFKASVRVTEN